jgi:hypothetical protein
MYAEELNTIYVAGGTPYAGAGTAETTGAAATGGPNTSTYGLPKLVSLLIYTMIIHAKAVITKSISMKTNPLLLLTRTI